MMVNKVFISINSLHNQYLKFTYHFKYHLVYTVYAHTRHKNYKHLKFIICKPHSSTTICTSHANTTVSVDMVT